MLRHAGKSLVCPGNREGDPRGWNARSKAVVGSQRWGHPELRPSLKLRAGSPSLPPLYLFIPSPNLCLGLAMIKPSREQGAEGCQFAFPELMSICLGLRGPGPFLLAPLHLRSMLQTPVKNKTKFKNSQEMFCHSYKKQMLHHHPFFPPFGYSN